MRVGLGGIKSVLGTPALLPMAARDRRRWFAKAYALRSISIGLLLVLLQVLLRDRELWLRGLIAFWMTAAFVSGTVIYRKRGVLPPHVWIRDLTALAVYCMIDGDYLGPAVMCSMLIVGFACSTFDRRSVRVLAAVSGAGIVTAALLDSSSPALVIGVFYPIALIVLVSVNTSAAKMAERSQQFNTSIADSLGIAMFETETIPPSGEITYQLYAGEKRHLGETVNDSEWKDILHPDDADVERLIDEAIAAGHDYRVRYRQRLHSLGDYRWIEEVGRVVTNDAGAVTRIFGMTRDITELVAANEMVDRFDLLVDTLDVAISLLRLPDPDDPTSLTIVYENQAAKRIDGGYSGRRVMEMNPLAFDVVRHRGIGYQMAAVAAGGPPLIIRDAHLRLDGQSRMFSLVVSPLPDQHCAVVMQDLTELLEARQELERLAFVDALTGLPNRARLRQLLTEAPVGSVLAVLDLDRFNEINDAFGHSCGDEVIVELAHVLTDGPEGSVTARLGGDEFGILVPPGVGGRHELGERIVEALARPVTLPNGLTLQTSGSVGIASKTKSDMSPDEVFRQADVAVNRAKRFRSGHEVYDPRNDTSAPHRMMLLGEMRRAIRNRELELHYQPIVDLDTGRVERVEGLLRWRHPSLGLLPPADFIEMMELSNLNGDVIDYSLDVVLAQYAEWAAAGEAMPISINVSGATVHDAALVTRIVERIHASGVPRWAIGLELAERQLLLGSGISDESMLRLSDAGVWLTIDHFGTGTSPLAGLRHIRANSLKIDRTLVEDLRSGDGSLISGIVTIAHNLGMLLVAEGVDDELSARWLKANGADRVQGQYVAPAAGAIETQRLFGLSGGLPLAR
jgi:diguanylate cyclase (GGDEF)-like protein